MSASSRSIPWNRLIAEGAVILVSILLAFAVDAWWDSRQERAREVSYLEQLAAEVEATLRNIDLFGGRAERLDRASGRLVQSYYEATPPHPDSVADWLALDGHWVVQPRLGTLQTLVSTGDLALIRDDSLRTFIPNHLTTMVAFVGFQAGAEERYLEAAEDLGEYIDLNQMDLERRLASASDSIQAVDTRPLTALPAGPTRPMASQDLPALVRTPEVHRILTRILDAKLAMSINRERMRDATGRLLGLVRLAQER